MQIKLKPLDEQVIVITGASSGIGLATAYKAAKNNAKVILISRNKKVLDEIAQKINSSGGNALAIAADVSNRKQLEKAAHQVIQKFGKIDSWINVAGVSIWGKLQEVSEQDQRRLFEVNFWGTYYGTLIAVELMKSSGGAIINIGSLASDVSLPIQGGYSASKHAVKGFTDTLRLELISDEVPISLTLIKPGSLASPLVDKVKNYTKYEPQLASPLYSPEEAADTILKAAVTPMREEIIGGSVAVLNLFNLLIPSMADKMLAKFGTNAQLKNKLALKRKDNLYQSGSDGKVITPNLDKAIHPSLYNRVALLKPYIFKSVFIGGLGLIALGIARKHNQN